VPPRARCAGGVGAGSVLWLVGGWLACCVSKGHTVTAKQECSRWWRGQRSRGPLVAHAAGS
jgi:hypothetical protein